MRIAKFVTSKYAFPYPDGKVMAPYDIADQLTRGLISRGHEVTWFAPKGTKTPAKLVDCNMDPIYQAGKWDEVPAAMRQEMGIWGDAVFLSHLASRAEEFDIVHIDSFLLALPFTRVMKNTPVVLTIHNPLDVPNIKANHDAHSDLDNLFFIAVSESQKKPLPEANWISTIHHGLDLTNYPYSEKGGDRWLFVSRIIPSKGVHLAVQAAKDLGEKLDIIGPIEQSSQEYYDREVAPYVDGDQISYLGAKKHDEIPEFCARAKGLIFPVQGNESFGLVVIEALAAGTPVIAYPNGAIPEIVTPGENGFLANSFEELKSSMSDVSKIDRAACRQSVEKRFSLERMVGDYEQVFAQIIEQFPSRRG